MADDSKTTGQDDNEEELQLEGFDENEIDPADLELLEKVGTGCTAEVFRGIFRSKDIGDCEVAVKQIKLNRARISAKERRAFDREVAIMPRIRHENLVKFLGVSSKAWPFRIITEFCAGGCCFELLHNSEEIELTWSQQMKMCMDTALAIDYLHKFNPQIIHRDLKSLNLLLARPVTSSDNVPLVKVSDFGLSRMKDSAPDAEWGRMTIAAGTCHWMAPEVYTGSTYDEKVDVYSYAMILFEIICREIPFEEEEAAAIGQLTVKGERPDLEAVPPDCPDELKDIMIRCWEHAPADRPSFDTIVTNLRAVQLS